MAGGGRGQHDPRLTLCLLQAAPEEKGQATTDSPGQQYSSVPQSPGQYEETEPTGRQDGSTAFFQSLELQACQASSERWAEQPGPAPPPQQHQDCSVMESIGLYWVNPADRVEERGAEEEPGLVEDREEELDVLQVLGLTPVTTAGPGRKWRLWNPEVDTAGWADEMLSSELYLPESAATDPTLMEHQVSRLGEPPQQSAGVKEPAAVPLEMKQQVELPGTPRSAVNPPVERPKRNLKRPKFFDETGVEVKKKRVAGSSSSAVVERKEKTVVAGRPGGTGLVECSGCQARVAGHQWGKHLVSHYHYHRALGRPEARHLILQNILAVVRQSPFQCGSCSFYFNWHADLVDHVASHPGPRQAGPHWCQVCMKVIPSHEQLVQHLASYNHTELVSVLNRSVPVVVKQISLVSCELCGKSFRYNLSLKKHMVLGHGQTEYELPDQPRHRCGYCDYSSLKPGSVKTHQFLVHPRAGLQYSCHVCRQQFSSREAAHQHRNTQTHRRNSRLAQLQDTLAAGLGCPLCPAQFSKEKDLEQHQAAHCSEVGTEQPPQSPPTPHPAAHPAALPSPQSAILRASNTADSPDSGAREPGPLLSCEQCSYTSSQQRLLRLHVKRQHGEGQPGDSCAECGVTFKLKSSLYKHMKIHSLHPLTKYSCSEQNCDFKCDFLSDLERHSVKHSELKSLACSECNFKCKRNSELRRHTKLTHDDTPFLLCQHCNYKTKNRTHLKRHLGTHELSQVAYLVHLDENDFMVGHPVLAPGDAPNFVTEQVV